MTQHPAMQTSFALARVVGLLAAELSSSQLAVVAAKLRTLEGSEADRAFYAATADNLERYEASE